VEFWGTERAKFDLPLPLSLDLPPILVGIGTLPNDYTFR
jgi:hypothetical protein